MKVDSSNDDLPPPYSPAGDATATKLHVGHGADQRKTFDTIQDHIASARHSYELSSSNSGEVIVNRTQSNQAPFHVSIERTDGVSQVSMRQNNGEKDVMVARARFEPHDRSFEILSDCRNSRNESSWTRVSCMSGGMLKSDSYHFVVRNKRLTWKRTHDHALGGSTLAGRHYKLVDDSEVGNLAPAHSRADAASQAFLGKRVVVSGNAIAVFSGGKQKGAHGSISWNDEYDEEVEIAALITIIVILLQD